MRRSQAKSDVEEATGQGGADSDETVAAYAIVAILGPSNVGEGDEWWRYVPSKLVRVCLTVNLDYGKLMQEFPHHPSVKDVSDTADLFNGAAAKLNISSLPNFAVRYPHSGAISIHITAEVFKLQASNHTCGECLLLMPL